MSFRKSAANKVGGKFLVFGATGTGKSLFGLTFPDSIAVDSEAGLAHYEGVPVSLNNGNTYNNLKFVDTTSDLDTLEEDLEDFVDIAEENKCQTLIVDSESKIYAGLQVAANEVEEKRARRKGKDANDVNISVLSWGRIKLINMRLQQTKIDLSSKGYHIVSVAQEQEIKDEDGKKVLGYKPDCYKTLPYDYDVVCRFFNKKESDGVHYYAEIIKDRTNVTKVGDIVENPCYDIWKEYFDSRSGLAASETSYKKDMATSTEAMIDKADKSEELASEFKEILKSLKDNKAGLLSVNKLMKEKGVDIKKLEIQDPKVLEELLDFAKLQLS